MPNDSSLPRRAWYRVWPLKLMWLPLFWTLPIVNSLGNDRGFGRFEEIGLLIALTAFQVFETMPVSRALTRYKLLWNLLRLVLCYLLIGFTGSFESVYYILLLWPIVEAAMGLKPVSTLLFTALTIGSYWSFLLFVPATYAPPVQALILRSLTLMIVGCALTVTISASDRSRVTT